MINKVLKYRLVISQILFLALKYKLLFLLLSEKKFASITISSTQNPINTRYIKNKWKQPKQKLISLSNKILKTIFPKTNCLIKSLVTKEFLQIYGFNICLNFGINKTGSQLKAHAWTGIGLNQKYIKIYQTI